MGRGRTVQFYLSDKYYLKILKEKEANGGSADQAAGRLLKEHLDKKEGENIE